MHMNKYTKSCKIHWSCRRNKKTRKSSRKYKTRERGRIKEEEEEEKKLKAEALFFPYDMVRCVGEGGGDGGGSSGGDGGSEFH